MLEIYLILERSKKYYMESIQNNSYGKKYEKKYLKYLFHFHFIKGKNSEMGKLLDFQRDTI